MKAKLFLILFIFMIVATTPVEACKKARRKTYTVEMDGFLCEGQKKKYKEKKSSSCNVIIIIA